MKWAEWNLLGEFEEKPNSLLACNSVKFGNFAESERLHNKGYWKKNNLKRLYWNIENYFEWSKISNEWEFHWNICISLFTLQQFWKCTRPSGFGWLLGQREWKYITQIQFEQSTTHRSSWINRYLFFYYYYQLVVVDICKNYNTCIYFWF